MAIPPAAADNTAIGNLALSQMTSGSQNTALGSNAGNGQLSGTNTIYIGYGATLNQPFGSGAASDCVNIGFADIGNSTATTLTGVVAIGHTSGLNLSDYSTIIGGDNFLNVVDTITDSTVIGARNSIGVGPNVVLGKSNVLNHVNCITIGNGITPAADNTITIGDASHTSVIIGSVTLSSVSGAVFPSAIVGNPGTEGSGIDIGGVTYDSLFKVSDISSADIAQSIIHRHSTTWEPIQVFARSNSNGAGHGAVVNSLAISSQYSAGWTGTEYNLFSRIHTEAAPTGAISDASSPGDIVFSTTPDGAVFPTETLRLKADKSAVNAGKIAKNNINVSYTFSELYARPITGTATLSNFGMTTTTLGPAASKVLASAPVVANFPRVTYTSAAAAGSAAELLSGNPIVMNPTTAYATGGFETSFVFSIADPSSSVLSSGRSFIGLSSNSAALSNSNPSTWTDALLGLGSDAGDVNFSIFYNFFLGAPTKIALGANFPVAHTAGAILDQDVYSVYFKVMPGDATVHYRVKRIDNTGAKFEVTGTVPLLDNGIAYYSHVWRNNGAVASACAVDFMGLVAKNGMGWEDPD